MGAVWNSGDKGSRLFDEALIARHRLRKPFLVAAAALVVLRLGAEFSPILRRPDLVLLDLWQSVRGTDRPSPQIVIVAIDEKSIARFGPPAWPRSEYVPLIERLSRAGARVIGMDFTFGALPREAENNGLLAEAMRKAGNVVIGFEFTGVGDASAPTAPISEVVQRNALSRFDAVALPPAPSLIEPEPVLAEAVAAIGDVWTTESEDGRIRSISLVIQHGGKAYPSLGLQMARIYTGTPAHEVELADGVVGMGTWDIPVSASGTALLSWPSGGERAFPQYSFLDVVRGDVPDEAFRDKAVLVAGTASGLDDRDFPFAAEAPGVLIYATFLDNVFRVDFVQDPTWAWVLEWGVFLAVCGLGVWLLPRLPTPALLAGVPLLAALIGSAAGFLFIQKGIWIEVVYPCFALFALLGVLVALRLTASEKETREVAAEKVEHQKLLGLSFQEKGMLDMALAIFDKMSFTPDMKGVYLHLGLDFENRGQREKAFRVYKKVFDADPKFEDVALRLERIGQLTVGAGGVTALGAPQTVSTPVRPEPVPAPLPAQSGGGADVEETGALLMAEVESETIAPGARTIPLRAAASPSILPEARVTSADAPGAGALPGGPVVMGARFGRYEVERHLGRGGMGDVYLVRDTVINRMAALKTIRLDTEMGSRHVIETRQRFYREAQTAGKLTHPNIVSVYDVGEDLGISYIVMEFVEGHTLTQLMAKQPLSLEKARHVIFHAATGLEFAHQNGVFHRDVKPDNIMVSQKGIVKVMDFGIARVVESNLTQSGTLVGTPAYMSPEGMKNQKVDARSDIFSLGVTLYELLAGKKPFEAETLTATLFAIMTAEPPPPSAVNAKIPAAWDKIVGRAMAKKREERYQTAREFAQAVQNAPVR